ncbi:hypothetical protein LOAG_09605 [Loa loa]|uniref:Transmembrane protein n=1 Tax=Loa loa TaxID=7209 RepID=A0A1S0TT62_LOALO|nr:hypothetical protein LOAG_09605 [Loa loa]EFO18890.1 hypothetical protein LOAG_09605 [Loa loa]
MTMMVTITVTIITIVIIMIIKIINNSNGKDVDDDVDDDDIRFWKSHALNLVIASFEKTFGTFRLFVPVAEPPPLPVFPSLRTDSLPPSSFNEPHIDNDSSPGNTT